MWRIQIRSWLVLVKNARVPPRSRAFNQMPEVAAGRIMAERPEGQGTLEGRQCDKRDEEHCPERAGWIAH